MYLGIFTKVKYRQKIFPYDFNGILCMYLRMRLQRCNTQKNFVFIFNGILCTYFKDLSILSITAAKQLWNSEIDIVW